MISSFKHKTGETVEVRANGNTYRGVLKGISETEVYLKTIYKILALPLSQVQSIRKVEGNSLEIKRPLS